MIHFCILLNIRNERTSNGEHFTVIREGKELRFFKNNIMKSQINFNKI